MEHFEKRIKMFMGSTLVLPLFLLFVIPIMLVSVGQMGESAQIQAIDYSEIKLCDLDSSVKTYESSRALTDKNSAQYKMFHEDLYGKMETDELGFHFISQDGNKYYTVAMASYFGKSVGNKFRITLEGDKVFYAILGDLKADKDTHEGNVPNVTKHCLAGSGDMIEFIINENVAKKKLGVDKNGYISGGSFNKDFDEEHQFKGKVVKVERITNYFNSSIEGSPNFKNKEAWIELNPYAHSNLYGQCTWFAWGRFYEIYGYSPEFTGDGYKCVDQLLKAHPDKFVKSDTPQVGSVGSSDYAHNHVWIVTGISGKYITIQEGNLDGNTNNFVDAQKDWQTRTLTLDELRHDYGNVVFANPKG